MKSTLLARVLLSHKNIHIKAILVCFCDSKEPYNLVLPAMNARQSVCNVLLALNVFKRMHPLYANDVIIGYNLIMGQYKLLIDSGSGTL